MAGQGRCSGEQQEGKISGCRNRRRRGRGWTREEARERKERENSAGGNPVKGGHLKGNPAAAATWQMTSKARTGHRSLDVTLWEERH